MSGTEIVFVLYFGASAVAILVLSMVLKERRDDLRREEEQHSKTTQEKEKLRAKMEGLYSYFVQDTENTKQMVEVVGSVLGKERKDADKSKTTSVAQRRRRVRRHNT